MAAMLQLSSLNFLAFASFLFGCASAADPAHAQTKEASYDVDVTGTFIALSVRELEPMAAWYERMFDMDLVVRAERPAPDGPVAVLQGENFLVEMQMRSDSSDPHSYSAGSKEAHKSHGVFKFGIYTSDIEAAAALFEARGAQFNHGIVSTSEPLLLRTFAIHDPEGNTIQFFGK